MKKIRKSNIAGEILFLLGIIILWQIFYVAGVADPGKKPRNPLKL